MTDIMDSKTDEELLRSALAEVAKANNELKCAEADVKKSRNRLNFLIVLMNKLIDRNEDSKK